MILWQMESPNPVPTPTPLVVNPGSKMRARFSPGNADSGITNHDLRGVAVAELVLIVSVPFSGIACSAFTKQVHEDLVQLVGITLNFRHISIFLDDLDTIS